MLRHAHSATRACSHALCTLLVAACAGGLAAHGQEISFEAEVDRRTLTTDDVLMLSLTVQAPGRVELSEPELEATDDFVILGTPQRQEGYSVVNMRFHRQSQRVYALQPRRAGQLMVPGAEVVVGGQVLTTQFIPVEVTQGQLTPAEPSGPVPLPPPEPPSGEAPFSGTPGFAVVSRVDKTRAYVNEQVTLEVDYYTLYRLPRTPGMEAPRAQGFLAEPLPPPEPDYVVVNGRQYTRYTSGWALFGTAPGEYAVQSATERLMLPPIYETREYDSNVVTVTVRSLPPAPAGAGFTGAVGIYTVSLSADKARLEAGEALTVRVRVDGEGNLGAVQAPALQVPDWCRLYPAGERRTLEPRTSSGRAVLGGNVQFEYLVIPRQAGGLEIPPVTLLHFRPAEGEYRTARSERLVVEVTPGDAVESAQVTGPETAIRYIRPEGTRLRARTPLPLTPWPYVILGACVLAVAGAGLVRVRADRRAAMPERARALEAAQTARKALRRAEAAPDAEFSVLLHGTMCRYLADRFGLPPAGLPAAEVEQRLAAAGVDPVRASRVREFIGACYARRFAPNAAGSDYRDETLKEARDLIDALERGERRR